MNLKNKFLVIPGSSKGFINIIFIIIAVVLVGVGIYFAEIKQEEPSTYTNPTPTPKPIPNPTPNPTPVACTMEAKQCPDGSYVGRTGPNCEFTKCPTVSPTPVTQCTKDFDCATNYICEGTQGVGTACSSNDPNCVPTFTITKGTCKLSLKAGSKCNSDQECQSGLICHSSICTNPIGRQCNGSSDTSCPSGSQCIQSCGPPVVRIGDPPPPFYCELNEYAVKPKMCPI